MTENCYIHIPFCKSKCNYCAFVSYACVEKVTGYVYSLLKEISDKYSGEALNTLYIGGGTPSLLPIELLKKILNKFNFADGAELTIELNPDDVTKEKNRDYLNLGINRISVGVQSFDDMVLQTAGRRHNAATAVAAIETIFESGCKNINADLIYGLPEQSMSIFTDDLKRMLDLPVTHISLYGLKIEENTPFSINLPQNLPGDDLQADMYLEACELLSNKGFKQYEISNFARPGFQSRHNLNYWNNNSYYGFGVAAHGFVDGFRYYNTSSLETYFESPSISEYAHHVTEKEALEEEIFLGLRKSEGINIALINEKFKIDFLADYKNTIEKYSDEFLIVKDGFIRFTPRGFMLSNIILSEFI